MRAFRIAVPSSDLARSRVFFEHVLGMDVDETVPSQLYFHCDGFIVALIDWAVENHCEPSPVRALPDDLYFATGDLDATLRRASEAGQRSSRRSRYALGVSGPSASPIPTGTHSVSLTAALCSLVAEQTGLDRAWPGCVNRPSDDVVVEATPMGDLVGRDAAGRATWEMRDRFALIELEVVTVRAPRCGVARCVLTDSEGRQTGVLEVVRFRDGLMEHNVMCPLSDEDAVLAELQRLSHAD